MTRTLAVLAIAVFAMAVSCEGSAAYCQGNPPSYAYLNNNPTLPLSTEVITLTVGRVAFVLRGQALEVQGNTINVTQIGAISGFIPTPTPCTEVYVGPLAAGVYTINYYLWDDSAPGVPPMLAASTEMTVAPAARVRCEFPFVPRARDSVAVSPPAPNSGQTVTIKGLSSDVVFPVLTAKVQGNIIDVTMAGAFNGFDAMTGCAAVDVGPLAPGVYTLNYFVSFISGPPSERRLTSQFTVADRTPQPNYQGLWWVPGGVESGWGINLAHEADTIVATWFTYNGDGKGVWSVMTAPKTATNTYYGTLYGTTASISAANPFHPASYVAMKVGDGILTFADENHATFTYPISGALPYPPPLSPPPDRTKQLTRQVFGPLPSCAFGVLPNPALATNFTGLWWAAPADSEPGWGINFAHQGDTIFATWFTYDLSGFPLWLVMTARQKGPGTYVGNLYRTAGPPVFANPFDPAKVVATLVGSATLRFMDGNNATLSHTVADFGMGYPVTGNVTGTRAITREIFAAPGTVCQ